MVKKPKTSDKDLEVTYRKLDAFAKLKEAISKELTDHPDYITEPLQLDTEVPYILLKRREGVVHFAIELQVDMRKLEGLEP